MSEDSLPQWLQWLFAGWPMIRANLPTFAIILVLMLGAIWWWMGMRYGDLIATKDGQIQMQDRQLADYREKLKGATPEEAKTKIDALEDKVRNTIGDRWKALTDAETTKLVALIAPFPHRRIQIMYVNYLGKDLAKSFADAFEKAGWTEVIFSEGGGLGYGLSTGRGNGLALTLKSAIETSTGQKVNSFGPTEDGEHSGLFVAVGINSLAPF